MSETTTETTTDETAGQTSADTSTEAESAADQAATTEGETALGDAGKKALDAMKTKWKEADAARKALEADFAEFKARAEGKEAEFAAAQEAQRIKDEALAAANSRIRNAEIRAAAKGVLTDPSDALTFLDLDAIEVSEDGEVDPASIKAALDSLIQTKPYLAVQDGKRFQGGADGGTRKESGASQLSEADDKRLYAEKKYAEIEQAKQAGRLNDYLGIK